jgi:hypothetical protein
MLNGSSAAAATAVSAVMLPWPGVLLVMLLLELLDALMLALLLLPVRSSTSLVTLL